MICLNTFVINGSKEIVYSSQSKICLLFLNRGITFAIFSLSGKTPVHSDWFIITERVGGITTLISLSNIDNISSCPELCLGLRPLIRVSTSSLLVYVKLVTDAF